MIPKAYPGGEIGAFLFPAWSPGRDRILPTFRCPTKSEVDPSTGKLRYLAGSSIAIHILNRDFVRRLAKGGGELPFHRADKKIATIDANGNDGEAGKTQRH